MNDQLDDLQKQKSKSISHFQIYILFIEEILPMKIGQKFGGTNGSYFSDSSIQDFSYQHYLSGITISYNKRSNHFQFIQFLYTSLSDQRNIIKSEIHGNSGSSHRYSQTFNLSDDERINKVQGHIITTQETLPDNSVYDRTWIRVMQFFTTKGRTFPEYIPKTNDKIFIDQHDGYVLGYVNGRSDQRIDQVQFHWYQMDIE